VAAALLIIGSVALVITAEQWKRQTVPGDSAAAET
jgi:hypothetical protein